MKSFNNLIRLMLCSVLLIAGSAGAREINAPEGEGQGEIQSLDFGAYRAFISGSEYGVSQNVKVEIGGTYGAFTMLEEGMLIDFTYLKFKDGYREINFIQEVNEIETF